MSDGESTHADSVTIEVEAENASPTADAGPDQSASDLSWVTLDSSASSDPDTLNYSRAQAGAGPQVMPTTQYATLR